MSIYWSGPEALRAEHAYRTQRLARAARRSSWGRPRRRSRDDARPVDTSSTAPPARHEAPSGQAA
jgi:hypothetical protein